MTDIGFNFPHRTIVSVQYSGVARPNTLLGPFAWQPIGPAGANGAGGDVAMMIGSAYGSRHITSTQEIAVFQGRTYLGRDGMSQPSNTNPSCGNTYIPNDPDCISWSVDAPAALSFSSYIVPLQDTVLRDAIPSHDIAHYDIWPAQRQIGGFDVWVENPEWSWTPDDPADGSSVNLPCGNSCEYFTDVSGTMRVRAYVNGRMQEALPRHVTVTDHLDLTATPSSGLPNYLASFVLRNSDSTNILVDYWWFIPDTGAYAANGWGVNCPTWVQGGRWTCPMNVPMSGTMQARVSVHYNHWVIKRTHVQVVPPKLQLHASKTSVSPGDSIDFDVTANSSPLVVKGWKLREPGDSAGVFEGESWGSCQPNQTHCRMPIYSPSVVIVTGEVNGVTSQDSISISTATGCPTASASRSGNSGSFAVVRSSNCIPDSTYGSGDYWESDDYDCSTETPLIAELKTEAGLHAMYSLVSSKRGGPSAVLDDLFAPDSSDCIRDASRFESYAILSAAQSSPEWHYTQGGVKGGIEPAKDIQNYLGDCTDFAWWATKNAFGPGWNHEWASRPGTADFVRLAQSDSASLAKRGYRLANQAEAVAGDIVVLRGHAGVLIGIDTSRVASPNHDGTFITKYRVTGWANNGSPAKPGVDPIDGTTGPTDFSPSSRRGTPLFFRALVRCQ